MQAPLPANELLRLQALHDYRILDTDREQAFDDLTNIAAQICRTPMAVVSLVDQNRQWFKSEVGLDASETSREVSFCAHAILQPGVFIVPDAARDPRFFDNALVTAAPHLRFYAGAVLHTQDGYALGTLCVLDRVPRDIDEGQKAALEALARQAMAQMELRRSLAVAERVGRYRSRLMAVMGHDLKQPLSTIQMSLTLIAPQLQRDDDKEVMGFATAAVERLGGGLDTLAEASRLDQAGVALTRFPVQRVLDSIRDNWALRARRKGLELRIRPCGAMIKTDERLLGTIVGNLVGNAFKYTETGGVLVGVRRRGDALRIDVCDTGIGIPEAQRGRIFEAFHQIDGKSEGLGLGLAIVRRTAELLGCEIEVRSAPGRGSCFSVTLGSLGAAEASADG